MLEEEDISLGWIETCMLTIVLGLAIGLIIWCWEKVKLWNQVSIDDSRTRERSRDDINETNAGSAQSEPMSSYRARGARGRAMDTGLFAKPSEVTTSAGGGVPDAGEGERATAAGRPDGGHREGDPAALHGGQLHDARRELDRGGEEHRQVVFEESFNEENFDEESDGDTSEGDPEAALPGGTAGDDGEDHPGRDGRRPGEVHEDDEMQEEETPERDEILEPSDREGSYIQPESSSPFSEAPMISSSEYGGRRVRFNAFGPGRSPPAYPYGPRNSSEEPENREQPAEVNEYDGVPILPIHEEDDDSFEYEPEYEDEGSSISGLTIPYAGLDDGPSGPGDVFGEADLCADDGEDILEEVFMEDTTNTVDTMDTTDFLELLAEVHLAFLLVEVYLALLLEEVRLALT